MAECHHKLPYRSVSENLMGNLMGLSQAKACPSLSVAHCAATDPDVP
jgi:hypothetical protein